MRNRRWSIAEVLGLTTRIPSQYRLALALSLDRAKLAKCVKGNLCRGVNAWSAAFPQRRWGV
jgi:hypothetical protein